MLDSGDQITGRVDLPLWLMHGLMLLAAVIVSSSFTVGEAITHGLDPAVLLLVRYSLAVLCLAPVMILNHGLGLPTLRQLAGYGMISASTVAFFWCMFEALRYTTALNTSVIFTLVPGISGIYSAVFLGERLGRNRLLALLFGMFGAIWVIFRGDINRLLTMDVNYGDLLFLAGCFMMAAYPPLVKHFHQRESMVVMTFWVLATGIVWLLLLSFPQLENVDWRGVESMVWGGIVYLAIFSTIITFYLTHIATIHLGPTRVLAYSYFYPSFVLVIDWVMGKGLPPAVILPGVLVVTMATVVLQSGVARIRRM
ncbi:MAG: DMT family transporter [Desulfurivibrionaceae bacterium]|nr:DMT family transporter [Desulfobulbales bacterium]MDT8335660.1 DMT family transporter [Desulfurivibrionaceae bacterium]